MSDAVRQKLPHKRGENVRSVEAATTAIGGRPSRPRALLRDEAYLSVRDYLLAEDEETGFSERSLATRLGLGLAPLRSALERLRSEGLVAVAPNSGLRVPEITAREIIDFYEMRLVIECHIAKHLAGRFLPAQSDALEEILLAQERAVETHDTASYHQLDLDFHTTLTGLHGNGEMVRALGQLRNKMYRLSRRLHRTHPDRLAVNAAQHRAIAEAIRSGDGAAARERMETHLVWGRAFTLDPDGKLTADTA